MFIGTFVFRRPNVCQLCVGRNEKQRKKQKTLDAEFYGHEQDE